jgi:hypothetical protein
MTKNTFDLLLAKVEPFLRPLRRYSREVSPAERLVITLRYWATGNAQQSLSFNFRVGRSTVCTIVKETSSAIWEALCGQYVNSPSTSSDCIANGRKRDLGTETRGVRYASMASTLHTSVPFLPTMTLRPLRQLSVF